MPFELVQPDEDHGGLGYQTLIVNWMNWLVMEYPDLNNDGVVVYLRGVDFRPTAGSYSVFIRRRPNQFIISPDQAVFWPIIMYFVDRNHHPNANAPPQRLNQVVNLMRRGDNPPAPKQAMIIENGQAPVPVGAGGYEAYRIISDIDFPLEIPRQDYSNPTSLCTLLDVPLRQPGPTACRVAGYFLLLRFSEGRYTIISHGQGEMTYETSTYVDIDVTWERSGERLMNQLQRQELQRQGVVV